MAKLGFDLCNIDLRPLTLTICFDITSVIGNHSWKSHSEKGVTGGEQTDRQTERQADSQTDRQTDRQTDWTIHRTAWLQLKIFKKILKSLIKISFKGKSIWNCYLLNVGHFFMPKYRLIFHQGVLSTKTKKSTKSAKIGKQLNNLNSSLRKINKYIFLNDVNGADFKISEILVKKNLTRYIFNFIQALAGS